MLAGILLYFDENFLARLKSKSLKRGTISKFIKLHFQVKF